MSHLPKLVEWLNTLPQIRQNGSELHMDDLAICAGDASARKYYYVQHSLPALIAVFSPPELEKNKDFAKISKLLEQHEIPASRLLASHPSGYMLQSNAGENQLHSLLDQSVHQSNIISGKIWQSYSRAIDLCVDFQALPSQQLPTWDAQLIQQEMSLSLEWFWEKSLHANLAGSTGKTLQSAFQVIASLIQKQPQTATHFDLHSRNLMLDASAEHMQLVDYQDAKCAAIGLDPCSVFMDCYVYFSEQFWQTAMDYYYDRARERGLLNNISKDQLFEYVRYLAVQRHTRILGTWMKLFYEFNKTHFMPDIPQVLHYLIMNCRQFPTLHTAANLYEDALGQWIAQYGKPVQRLTIDTLEPLDTGGDRGFVAGYHDLEALKSW